MEVHTPPTGKNTKEGETEGATVRIGREKRCFTDKNQRSFAIRSAAISSDRDFTSFTDQYRFYGLLYDLSIQRHIKTSMYPHTGAFGYIIRALSIIFIDGNLLQTPNPFPQTPTHLRR